MVVSRRSEVGDKRRAEPIKEPAPSKKSTPEKKSSRSAPRLDSRKPCKNLAAQENIESSCTFQDETELIAINAVENYFMQGKSAVERSNVARVKRGKRAQETNDDEDDENVENLSEKLVKCNLSELREYITAQTEQDTFKNFLNDLIENQFDKWILYLASGFNLLLNGVGSKRDVLTCFSKNSLGHFTWMRVDARREDSSPKILLSSINKLLNLNTPGKGLSLTEWARAIVKKMARNDIQLILLVDNIESSEWRYHQEVICTLLEQRNVVKLVATVDHIYSGFIWNSRQLASLSLLHININTLNIPLEELLTGESRILGLDARASQSVHSLQSLDVFWKSLAHNSQKLFVLFFEMFCETKKSVKFWDLFNAAKDEFLVSTDSALRTQLVEFKDHRIIKWTRGDDGNDQLVGLIDKKLLDDFLKSKGIEINTEL